MSYARGFENPNPSKQGGLKSEERRAKSNGSKSGGESGSGSKAHSPRITGPRLEMPIWAWEVIRSAKMTATCHMVVRLKSHREREGERLNR